MPEPIDPPLTPEEIAESRRISEAHMKLVGDALENAPKQPRRSRKSPPRRARSGVDLRPERLLPSLALLLTPFCKRGACRRAGHCCFGERPADAAGVADPHGAAPCFARLPLVVQYVLPYAIMRWHYPERFRDEFTIRCEKGWLDFARRKIAEAAAAREAQSEGATGGTDAASDALPPPPRQPEPFAPTPRPRLTQF
ncbi:MAG: hypothetical protein V7704_05170 [Aurantimonas endophytica]|uniref:hypothetical protein n=1 Tax=Aurantimonas endophytica TaxID=1522175 RepID=UPI00300145E2